MKRAINYRLGLGFAISMATGFGFGCAGAIAQPQQTPFMRFASPRLEQLYRDLVHSGGSEDFFKRGRDQFEREIQQVNQPPSSERLLKVNSNLQPQQDKLAEPPLEQPRSR
jgi:hypothetical protein